MMTPAWRRIARLMLKEPNERSRAGRTAKAQYDGDDDETLPPSAPVVSRVRLR